MGVRHVITSALHTNLAVNVFCRVYGPIYCLSCFSFNEKVLYGS